MTDHPRFQMIGGKSCLRHGHYHGAPVVDLLFRLADWWLSLGRRSPKSCAHLSDSRIA